MECIGGINLSDVIRFQTKIMLGSQYDRVMNAGSEEEIIVACLRVAWNDAFRHVSVNKYKDYGEAVKNLYGNNTERRTKAKNDLGLNGVSSVDDAMIISEYICQKILNPDGTVYKTFINYAQSENTKDKVDVVTEAIENRQLREAFASIKKIDDAEQPLCFGHIQKLFNMATKYYLCLYMLKDEIQIKCKMGEIITERMLENADCPIDSIILKKLGGGKKFANITWSKIDENELDKYIGLQEIIGEKSASKLYFDFANWNGGKTN